ncbi:hypothetical protein [Poseidonibacter ostreae]|jgi:hypothetical protein|uniref:Uncharacterized protein n=1 Tax=Poseidonibacter ostreae TaxID=2654171 RepID=A0A6L4WSQ5_9BACT|nr:hypothetical protein [Poseidonibacter ostreae]KAB7886282.1 hypothetical protein GA417_06020 [Poseidonibacter ostreae]KAB7888887.1 hypothetical protein GBG19_07555 [Poseidonibacter ostreae]KAB7890054.1 hypothetical protein GBG18_09870 [Poseidonibacter ostreae]MAC84585.1 hypothetical protein [Arcobacter sp.]|tara:strand:- start:551 stop:976 length:426 start_codon:yes stop_codon:yes gene_type:complete
MKKLTLKVLTSIALLTSGFISANASDYSKIDVEKECSVKTNGISKVIETAKKYNDIAKKEGLEFRRLGVNNSGLIASVEEAIKTKAKEVNPKDFKGKASKTKLETNFAAHRSCKFAIRALQQADEAKSTWRLAIPGDGYKY